MHKRESLNSPDYSFSVEKKSKHRVTIQKGRSINTSLASFFEEYPPTIWFADGSSLTGNYFRKAKNLPIYPKDKLVAWDWAGIDISKESQKVNPKEKDSIQYNVIQRLKRESWDIIHDDDGAGEVADIVTIRRDENCITIHFYHLKYAKKKKVGNDIGNFYEVCGQAQKSAHWKHKKNNKELFDRLRDRKMKKRGNETCSRLEKGTLADLERLGKIAKKSFPVKIKVFIVQPSLSKSNPSDDILTLLGVTESFLKETAAIDLEIIVSP